MEVIQNLYEAAALINQTALVEKTTALIEFIRKQDFTHIAVTGAGNSGKTTFINEIIGREVWEPGTLDEDEKPLRISFEPLQEDENFNCLFVSNPPWHDLKVILYELRENILFSDNVLSEDMYSLDMVFLVISAMSPFGKDDVETLKALAPLKRQVVVNGMQKVAEVDREKVLNYISKINDSLNLPPVIILESGSSFGKAVRNLVPSYVELQELREKKCRNLFKKMLDTLELTVRNEIENLTKTQQQSAITLSIQNDGLSSGCYTLRMDVEDYKKAAIEAVTGKLSSRRENLIDEILKAAKQTKDSKKIQSAAEEKYKALSDAALEALEKIFLEDLKKTDSAARLLGVPKWTSDTFNRLAKFSPQNILDQISLEKLTVRSSSKKNTTPLLVGSGLVAGGLTLAPLLTPTLAPLPPLVSIGGAVVALGYGIASHMQNKKRKTREEQNALDDAIRQAIDNIKDFARNIAAISYGKISSQILLGEQCLSNPPTTKNESRLAELNAILNAFNQMKSKLEA